MVVVFVILCLLSIWSVYLGTDDMDDTDRRPLPSVIGCLIQDLSDFQTKPHIYSHVSQRNFNIHNFEYNLSYDKYEDNKE